MPRPPKPPMDLIIEALSDGREVRPTIVDVDDFTGEISDYTPPQDLKPKRKLKDGFELRDEEWKRKRTKVGAKPTREQVAEAGRQVLIKGGMLPPDPPVIERNRYGKPYVGLKLLGLPKKPWRRI